MTNATTTTDRAPAETKTALVSSARIPPLSICIVLGVLLALVPIVRIFSAQIESVIRYYDGAAENIATALLLFLAANVFLIWFCWWSGYSFAARRTMFYLPIVIIAVLTALLRFEGFDGFMIPAFNWRWAPRHEAVLRDRPQVTESQSLPVAPMPNDQVTRAAPQANLATETAEDFPQFLGPQRNNYLPDVRLAADWSQKSPREIWRRDIGPGWASFSARNGYAVTIEQRDDEEWTSCYELETGEPVWHHAEKARHYHPLGGLGPRATPTIDGGRVYSQGSTGILCCLDGANGTVLWRKELLDYYKLDQAGSETLVAWGRSGSPLIVDDLVIVPAGGEGEGRRSLIAFNKLTGDVAWEGGSDQISYASPMLATLGGVRQIVIVNEATITGHEVTTGKTLWSADWFGRSSNDANVSQAFPLPGDRVFVSKGYGLGAALFQLRKDGESFVVEPVWESRRVMKTKFTNPVIIGDYVYGLSDGILECVELETGNSRWKRGRYGHGQVLGVGSHLLVLGEYGELMLVDASPKEFSERGKIQVLEGKTWNNLCLYGKRLLVRNGTEAACYELP
jgi:outer membrane protein assembly factor BamB